jgi:hypothetical protein
MSSIQFAVRTHSIQVTEHHWANSGSFNITPISRESLSDMANRVRFGCSGSSPSEMTFHLHTWHTFVFRPQRDVRLLAAHTHFLPEGTVSLAARKANSWLYEMPGFASCSVDVRMKLEIITEQGIISFSASSGYLNIFELSASADWSHSVSKEAVLESDLLEFTRTVGPIDVAVWRTSAIAVIAEYKVRAGASHYASFDLDFQSFLGLGTDLLGLNCPMAVINIEE